MVTRPLSKEEKLEAFRKYTPGGTPEDIGLSMDPGIENSTYDGDEQTEVGEDSTNGDSEKAGPVVFSDARLELGTVDSLNNTVEFGHKVQRVILQAIPAPTLPTLAIETDLPRVTPFINNAAPNKEPKTNGFESFVRAANRANHANDPGGLAVPQPTVPTAATDGRLFD